MLSVEEALLMSLGGIMTFVAIVGVGSWAVIRWAAPKVHDDR